MEAEPSIATSEEVSELFQALNWSRLWPRLVGHTLATMKRRHRLKGSKNELHDAARELVEECMRRVFVTGSRRWNKTHYPDVEVFLFDVLDSLVSNWLRERKQRLKIDGDVDFETLAVADSGSAASAQYSTEVLSEVTKHLNEMGAEDDELLIFNARVFDGLTKPEEIRENIGMTEAEYHNAVRRLGRRLSKIKTKLDL